jgi:hypothetical protein
MNTLPRTAVVAYVVAVLLNVSAPGRADEPRGDQEPPMIFYLEAGGKKTPIELDKPFKLEVLTSAPTATLRVEPYRVFPYAGISFRYPRSFTFEANFENRGVRIWSLEGPSHLIMVQEYPGALNHAAIRGTVLGGLTKTYADAKKLRESDMTLKYNGGTLNGRRLEMEMAGTLLHQDLFSFANGKASVVLMLQDTPNSDGTPSAGRIIAEKMLRESLKIPPK